MSYKGTKLSEYVRNRIRLANSKPKVKLICKECGKEFEVWPARAKQNPKYCSTTCYGRTLSRKTPWNKGVTAKDDPRLATDERHGLYGKRGPKWKGGRFIEQGYVLIWSPDHPHARRGYVKEHRVVVEKSLGRLLGRDEVIHHINGDTTDNRIENLLVTSATEHSRIHHRQKGHKINENAKT